MSGMRGHAGAARDQWNLKDMEKKDAWMLRTQSALVKAGVVKALEHGRPTVRLDQGAAPQTGCTHGAIAMADTLLPQYEENSLTTPSDTAPPDTTRHQPDTNPTPTRHHPTPSEKPTATSHPSSLHGCTRSVRCEEEARGRAQSWRSPLTKISPSRLDQ